MQLPRGLALHGPRSSIALPTTGDGEDTDMQSVVPEAANEGEEYEVMVARCLFFSLLFSHFVKERQRQRQRQRGRETETETEGERHRDRDCLCARQLFRRR